MELCAQETRPRLCGQVPACALYRWEIILGVAVLGYPADAAITAPRLGAEMVLIVPTGLWSLGIDVLSRTLRLRIGNRHLRLSAGTAPRRSAPACA